MKPVWSIFPKFFPHLDPQGLAELVREVGLDTTNMVIREGYWVTPDDLARTARAFVEAMSAQGLTIRYATAGYSVETLVQDDTPLAVLADCGIREFRLNYFQDDPGDIRHSLAQARAGMEAVARICERRGIRAVYQVHHGRMLNNSLGAWHLVQGLPERYVGIKLDPGNQCFEGWKNWRKAANLLGGYLAAVGLKDTVVRHEASRANEPGKGWSRHWAPAYEGVVNWQDFFTAMRGAGFSGTYVLMPFYDESQPDVQRDKLKREVAYLRQVAAAVDAAGESGHG